MAQKRIQEFRKGRGEIFECEWHIIERSEKDIKTGVVNKNAFYLVTYKLIGYNVS